MNAPRHPATPPGHLSHPTASMKTSILPILRGAIAACVALGSALPLAAQAPATLAERENAFYRLVTVPIPEGIVLEAGAIQHFGKDRLAVTTRPGDIRFVDGALGAKPTPANVRVTRSAQGLHEDLGSITRGLGGF